MIHGLSNSNIILGGDWNATWDNRPVEQNIDVINMREIPNRSRSNNILNLCRELNLVDPFRSFHPSGTGSDWGLLLTVLTWPHLLSPQNLL